MQLNTLAPRHKNIRFVVVGRGGKRGKTSGRGGKGQTARAGHKIRPELRDLIKKLPKRRGYGRNRSHTVREERRTYTPVTLATLESVFKVGEIVTPAALLSKGVVRAVKGRAPYVKVLGTGPLTKALVVKGCAVSKSAVVAIAAAGGSLQGGKGPTTNA